MKMKIDDVLQDLTTYEEYKFNTILTDPPYNLGSTWIIDTDGTYQIKGKPQDFMNKWGALDGPALDTYFKESFRVLKYGGYMLMFGMDRQLGPLHYYAVKNGFEINQSLYWYFVSNFPKATDAGKMIDKRLKKEREVVGTYIAPDGKERKGVKREPIPNGEHFDNDEIKLTTPASDLAKVFDGYKYSKAPLKQMVETICVFSKPTKNKSVLDDIIEWSEDVDLLNYCPKVGKKERNMGLDNEPDKDLIGARNIDKCGKCDKYFQAGDGRELCNCDEPEIVKTKTKNTHPTLKPINLIYEIARLFKLPDIVNQKVYVPFSGAGSEVIGLLKAGYNHKNIYACELNPEYVEISKKRIKHWYDTNKS